ncbi:SMI1/KNR4 family protein [Streptomyces sp. NPDC018045]|uniref:SMI1/KNR4 family protein n=1 Tax=Streptomyces sp. NPDC018045 TaxID=3365037 RepID=UPI0037BADE96
MWKDLARSAWPGTEFNAGAPVSALADVEHRLDDSRPAELTSLLRQSDGVRGPYGVDVVWPLQQIVDQNLHVRLDTAFAELYMPFDALLFFGDNGGDQFAFVRASRRPDIFVWEHEEDSRRWTARDLHAYLQRSLAADGDDWYR